jgi:hypothetical protein
MNKHFAAGATLMLASLVMGTAVADELTQRKESAAAVTKAFVQQLGGAMQKEMQAGGPVSAVRVCSELAPTITSQISREHGWKVTRVSSRVRNPMLGLPDPWEQQVLVKFQERVAKGEAIEPMAFSEVVTEPDGKYFRFMKAIGVQPQCLTCHGGENDIKPEVRALIDERYPHDKARGYKAGDLRGAVSIKQPM